MSPEIYLDANATSPVLPAAIAAAAASMRDGFGNPSSTHAAGLRAKATLDDVRARACALLGVGAGRLSFTSGATEAIQAAVLSVLCDVRERRLRGEYAGELLLYGATEHKAVPESLAHWNRLLGTGLALCVLPVDQTGRHDMGLLRELAPRAAMVCTMAANNETGVISDLDGIGAVLASCAGPARWMVDSVQALGKMDLDLARSGIDYAPFSGHKLYAPKGIGMLYVRAGAPFTALLCGGGQESGQRAGTENMAGIAALGAVLAALDDGTSFRSHLELSQFRLRLSDALRKALPGIEFNAPFANSLPTTLNFSVPGLSSKELLDLFDAAGVRVSAGSACSSAKAAPSYVLEAMQLPAWRCAAAVRLSFGPMVDAAFIDAACARIAHCGDALRTSCLIPSAMPAASCDGIVQLGVDGACTWLVLDAASRSCVVIDAQAPQAPRIAEFIRCQSLQLRAVIDTHSHEQRAEGRTALFALLGGEPRGALGWPAGSVGMTLANGTPVDAIVLGQRVLARLRHGPADTDGAAYLLGVCSGQGLLAAHDVAYAFTGVAQAPGLENVTGPATIFCAARDTGTVPCTMRSTPAGVAGAGELGGAALGEFMRDHPGAILVDVREPFEYAAAGGSTWHGSTALSVPLSRLADRLPEWLRGDRPPLVFFCRSGARSARAVECLRRLGYRNTWQVRGGLVMDESQRRDFVSG